MTAEEGYNAAVEEVAAMLLNDKDWPDSAQPADPPATALREALGPLLASITGDYGSDVADRFVRDVESVIAATLAAHPTPAEELREAQEIHDSDGTEVRHQPGNCRFCDARRPSPAAAASALALAPDVGTAHDVRSGR
jgi:hypothetical protein